MKKILFEGREFLVDNNVRFITQDPQGTIRAHVRKPKQCEIDHGCPTWESAGSEELFFPSSICKEIVDETPAYPLGDMS